MERAHRGPLHPADPVQQLLAAGHQRIVTGGIEGRHREPVANSPDSRFRDRSRRMQFLRVLARAVSIGLVALGFGASDAAAAEPLSLEAKIPLDEVAGRIDHLAYDSKRGRLIVAELGNNSVSILDLDQRRVVHRIPGLKTPQGVAYLAATDTIYVAG